MRLPDPSPSASPFGVLLAKELRDVLAGRAFWVLHLILSPLIGYGFIQAVGLYTEASRSALDGPALARSLSPLDGVLVPTFGAVYLGTTLLFPFVAIRAIGAEKENGGLKLLLQMPYAVPTLVAAKFAALGIAWAITLAPALSALVIWRVLGGHLWGPETVNLLLGYLLYAGVIGAIGLLAAAVTDNSASAAIVALAVTIGFWVLDFAASGQSGLLQWVAGLSLTPALRAFEQGLLSASTVLSLLVGTAALLGLAAVWLPPGQTLARKLLGTAMIVGTAAMAIGLSSQAWLSIDMTEDRRNSFSVADTQALRTLDKPLTVTVHLAPEDPRYHDLARGVLSKLRRIVPGTTIVPATGVGGGLFGAPAVGEDYGLIILDYAGRRATTRSTSAEEILPLIYGLAGLAGPTSREDAGYPGYPLVAEARFVGFWFYLGLPGLVLAAWAWRAGAFGRRTRKITQS